MVLSRETVREYGFGGLEKNGPKPVRVCLAAMSGVGKNYWLKKYMEDYGLLQYDQVIVLTPKGSRNQQVWKDMRKKWVDRNGISHFHLLDEDTLDGLEAKAQELIDRGAAADPMYATCVILDDLQELTRGGKRPWIQNLFVSGRHQNCSTWDLRQTCFGNRTARLQCQYFVLGKMGSRDECARLFQQIALSKSDRRLLELAFKRITDREGNPPGFLILDLTASAASQKRARDTSPSMLIPQLSSV